MNLNTFRSNITKPAVALRYKFLYEGDDYTSLLLSVPTITRNVNLAAGKATIVVNNAGQWWNFIYSTNVSLGGTAEFQIYIDGDAANALTLFKGKVQRPKFRGARATLTIRDFSGDWLNTKVGSNRQPANWYFGTDRVGETAESLVWHLLTTEGELSSLSSPSNTDIDYTAFAAWRDQHIKPNNYSIRARPTGHTISEILMRVCQHTHSYIWVNLNGKVSFAPPFNTGLSYDESNTNLRDLEVNEDRILNKVEVRNGYNFTQGIWVRVTSQSENTTSSDRFGTFPKTIEDRILNHATTASAEADRDATLTNYAFPLRFVKLRTGPRGIIDDLGNQLTVSDTLRGWSGINPLLEDITYDLDKWEVTMKARWPW